MVGARELLEPRGDEDRDRFGPALEGEQVDVVHGAIGLEIVDGLSERGALERQRADPALGEQGESASSEGQMTESVGEVRLSASFESRHERPRPLDRPSRGAPLDRRQQQAAEALFVGEPQQEQGVDWGQGGGAKVLAQEVPQGGAGL